MTSLVLLEYDDQGIKQPSRSAVAAATALGEVHVLVAGADLANATAAAAKLPGVTKVLVADNPALDHLLAEPTAALLLALAPSYSHLLAATTAVGKNVMPRVAALLDVQPISDIAEVVDADTFVRPIYAGNGLATVKSSDTKKVITVRAASFDPVAAEGGSATTENVTCRRHARPVQIRLRRTLQERAAGADRRPCRDFRRPRHAERRKLQAYRADS